MCVFEFGLLGVLLWWRGVVALAMVVGGWCDPSSGFVDAVG